MYGSFKNSSGMQKTNQKKSISQLLVEKKEINKKAQNYPCVSK